MEFSAALSRLRFQSRIIISPLFYDKEATRKVQIQQLSESYATELEKRVRQFPTQWYNFYDFWS